MFNNTQSETVRLTRKKRDLQRCSIDKGNWEPIN